MEVYLRHSVEYWVHKLIQNENEVTLGVANMSLRMMNMPYEVRALVFHNYHCFHNCPICKNNRETRKTEREIRNVSIPQEYIDDGWDSDDYEASLNTYAL